jgi:hypothetical protein
MMPGLFKLKLREVLLRVAMWLLEQILEELGVIPNPGDEDADQGG